MRVSYSSYIARSEWNWLIAMSSLMLTLVALPVMVVELVSLSRADLTFMGAVHQLALAAANFSRMEQGMSGSLLTQFLHTPEAHDGLFVQPLYAGLGSVSAFTGIPTVILYHVGRVLAGYFMCVALYHLGAVIWTKVRARRLFFVLAILGGSTGLAWNLLDPAAKPPDFFLAGSYPFYGALVSIDFPLTVGTLALIASVLVNVLRPGFAQEPSVNNGGATVFVSVLVTALLYPSALLPVLGAYVICLAIDWLYHRQVMTHQAAWLLWAIVPATPVGAYLAVLISTSPLVGVWATQEMLPPFGLVELAVSNSVLLAVGLPALWRAARTFGRDVDRYVLVWLGLMVAFGLLAPRFGTTFLIGLTLPLAYFASRALDETWLPRLQRRFHRHLFLGSGVLLVITPLLIAFGPLVPLLSYAGGSPSMLDRDYRAAAQWIDARERGHPVVLAAPNVALWLPAMSRLRVVYGHPTETMFAAGRRADVWRWYAQSTPVDCYTLTQLQVSSLGQFRIAYALLGPEERRIGAAACLERWERVHQAGDVTVLACDADCRAGGD